MIAKTITYINEYNNGFEATVAVSPNGVIELDITYVSQGDLTDESIGLAMSTEAATALSEFLQTAVWAAQKQESELNGL